MIVRTMLEAFRDWTADGASLVLASVYETSGSTYSKAGAHMLIRADGHFQGMLSGGCLEGDLAERAVAVLDTGLPQTVTYDLGPNDDELWGLGVGCDGLMRIFLQPLQANQAYQPLRAISNALAGEQVEAAATVISSNMPDLASGSAYVSDGDTAAFSDVGDAHLAAVKECITNALSSGESKSYSLSGDSGEATLLVAVLTPPPEILLLGAGLDAEPVVSFAAELGWRITVLDHRPAYLDAGAFNAARERLCAPVAALSATLDLNRFAAAIVMSHHLDSDRRYLLQLAKSSISYIGLLGPVNRRQRLLEELGDDANALAGRLFSPAGMDIGGTGPAAIALSIIAEVHQVLYGPSSALRSTSTTRETAGNDQPR